MSLIDAITSAQVRAAANRPKAGGFPYLAEELRLAGVTRIEVTVPSWTTVLTTPAGSILQQGEPMVAGNVEVPPFDRQGFVAALKADQAGQISFPMWMEATWASGVVWYSVDLGARTCTYRSPAGDTYVEEYAAVDSIDTP